MRPLLCRLCHLATKLCLIKKKIERSITEGGSSSVLRNCYGGGGLNMPWHILGTNHKTTQSTCITFNPLWYSCLIYNAVYRTVSMCGIYLLVYSPHYESPACIMYTTLFFRKIGMKWVKELVEWITSSIKTLMRL